MYLVDRVVPMLPHKLSNGICSLNPNVDRLAMSCVMEINGKGYVSNYQIFKSVIRSKKQMNYDDVNSILEDNVIPSGYEEYVDTLRTMNELSNILRKKMVRHGYIEFNIKEPKIIVDDSCHPVDIKICEQRTGEKLIENFMIVANETVAGFIEDKNLPGIYRVHDKPNKEKLIEYLKFLGPEDLRDEIEKDVWELKNLDIKIRSNPIYNVKTLDFRKIYQPDIREECKKAVYMNLQYEAIGTVQGELTIMRIFSEYLQKEYSKIKSCSEIDREVLEEFLIHLSTKDTSHSANSSYVISLRRQLETIGKIYSYERLEHLFINTDIPPEVNAEFRVYSDDEMKRLNAEITQMDVQIARCLLIHQMLGTRISDTLTLRPDCLTRENGQDMIEIYQVKTKRYKKPISKELAKLLQSSIEYTQEKFGDTEYIFVNEKEPDRPMQYMAIKTKVMSMIQEKQLKDDHGELFGFGTHMFRHYYGVKLTEMHLDDWTIARLLGHKRLNNVQHYRKMSNQRMADETREVRQRMSDIIYMSLARWGEEYEQIRQDD